MLAMLLLLHPAPTMVLIKAVMFHDTPEERFGDVPSPALWANQELSRSYKLAHANYLEEEFGLGANLLTEEEIHWLDCLDKLEAFYFAQHQMKLGNYHAQEVVANIIGWFSERGSNVPELILRIVETLQDEILDGK